MAILRIGRGQYVDALEWARRTYGTDPPIHGNRSLPDIVEVATRAEDDHLAAQALTVGVPDANGIAILSPRADERN